MAPLLAGLLLVQGISAAPTSVDLGAERPWLLDLAWERAGGLAGARFGSALAAGDVDGDGHDDLVVGSPGPGGPGSFGGRVELFLGGPGGLAEAPVWTRTSGWPGARFGASLAVADVNGDGFDDIVVGAPDFDVPAERPRARAGLGHSGPGGTPPAGSRDEGAVSVFLGNALAMPTLQRVVLGRDSGEHLGSAVARAGDVNADGRDDVLIGASGKDGNRGLVLLFHGTAAGIPALPAWALAGVLADKGFGTLLAGAGDQNGDGYGDFALGHTTIQGVTRVAFYLGGPAGPVQHWIPFEDAGALAALELGDGLEPDDFAWGRLSFSSETGARLRSNNELLLPDTTNGIRMGAALAGADVDGDGHDDLAASAPQLVPGPGLRGRVYVFRRGADQQETVPIAVLDGDQPGSGFGTVLAGLDADGDGADELVVAAPTWNAGDGGEGLVRVHRGNAGPFTDPLFTSVPYPFSLRSMGGDFDGDGHDDLLLTSSGLARVMRGSPTGPTGAFDGYTEILQPGGADVVDVGDLNADGFDDLVYTTAYPCGALCENKPMGVYLGGSAGLASSASWYRAAQFSRLYAVGDIDGDGYGEILLERLGLDELYFGTALGPSAVAGQELELGQNQGLGSGDVNGDGLADVVVHQSLPSPSTACQYVVLLGSPGGLVESGWVIPVTSLARLPRRLPDVNGDGYADLPASDGSLSGLLGVFLGSPSGPTPGEGLRLNARSTSIRVAASDPRFDVDGDGREDILVGTSGFADNGASTQLGLRVHLGAAAGLRLRALWGDEATEPFLGDTDGDGKLELGYVSFAAGGLRFLELR